MEVRKAQRISQLLVRAVGNSSPRPLQSLKFETLGRMSRDAVFMVDARGVIIYWNPAAERIFGYSSAEIVGKPFYVLILPAQDVAEIKMFLMGGPAPFKNRELETDLFHKDGHAIKVSVNFSAAEDEKKWCMVGVARLIEQRGGAGKEELLTKVERLSRRAVLGEEVAGAMHGVSNLIMTIESVPALLDTHLNEMFSQLRRQGVHYLGNKPLNILRDDLKEEIDLIIEGGRKIEHLCRRFMNFGTDPRIVMPSAFSASEKIKAAVDMIQHSFNKREVRLATSLYKSPSYVFGYAEDFQEVIYNLLRNALQASQIGGRVMIYSEEKGNALLIKVADNGCGIPESVQPFIFEPFFTTKDETDGSGIGLSLAKKRIGKMDGDISFVSKVDRGTTFTITIPILVQRE